LLYLQRLRKPCFRSSNSSFWIPFLTITVRIVRLLTVIDQTFSESMFLRTLSWRSEKELQCCVRTSFRVSVAIAARVIKRMKDRIFDSVSSEIDNEEMSREGSSRGIFGRPLRILHFPHWEAFRVVVLWGNWERRWSWSVCHMFGVE
jgi:hypothetical protein